MSGATNGRFRPVAEQYHAELVEFERLPVGEQEAFQAALDTFLESRDGSLTPAERAVAFHVGRAMWRRSWEHGWTVAGRQMRAAMGGIPKEGA